MKKLLFILIIVGFTGCSKHKNPTPTLPPTPGTATLSAPTQNAVCKNGTYVTNSTSSIEFEWAVSSNTDEYELDIEDLLTDVLVQQLTTKKTDVFVTLPENTPYAWYVISKSNQTTTTTQSETWRFYSAGAGVVTYPPFPAEIISPTFGEIVPAGSVDLSWKGSSVTQATIASYDVYFGSTNSPKIVQSAIIDTKWTTTVSSGNTYYWKIITRDQNGDTSDSGVFQFSVN
jgi:hypothetical protein